MTVRSTHALQGEQAIHMSSLLNKLLSNYRISYLNVHGFHWLLRGDLFFNIHTVLEDLYKEQIEQIDAVAERLLSVGLTPVHTYEEILSLATIAEEKDITDAKEIGTKVLSNLHELRNTSSEVLEYSQEIGDVGTSNKMEDDIEQLEKKIWMWSAFVDRQ